MSDHFDSRLILASLPPLSRRAPKAAPLLTQNDNFDDTNEDKKTSIINYRELREQQRKAKIETLKNEPPSQFEWSLLQQALTNTNYRELRELEWRKKQKKTFLEANPTKNLSFDELKRFLPDEWELKKSRQNNFSEFVKCEVRVGCQEYVAAQNLFTSGVIKRLERNENPYSFLMYLLKSVEFGLVFGSNEVKVFHGTNAGNIDSICRENFDHRRAGTSTGIAHGKGVYFSPKSGVSMQYSRNGQCMFLARAQQGRICAGNSRTILPSPNHDTTGGGDILVKYYDYQYFPEYVVHY